MDATTALPDLLRTLMRQGYLPLLAPDLTEERLERAGLLISIAPAREFSPAERRADRRFPRRPAGRSSAWWARKSRGRATAAGRFRLSGSALAGSAGRKRPRAGAARRQRCSATGQGTRHVRFYAGLAR